MKNKTRFTPLLIAGLASLVTLVACDQVEKANALIDQANVKINAFRPAYERTLNKHNEFRDMLTSGKLDTDPTSLKTFATTVVSDYQNLFAPAKEIADKFDAASKMKVPAELKEYWSLKAQIWQKRQQIMTAQQDKVKAVIEGMEKNELDKVPARVSNDDTNIDKWDKEVAATEEQAEKVIQAHPKSFQKS